jgi:hypothetical protein
MMIKVRRIVLAAAAAATSITLVASGAVASGWYTVSGSGNRSATISRNPACNCIKYWAGTSNGFQSGTFKVVDAVNGRTVRSGSWPGWPGAHEVRGTVYGLYGKYYITGTGGTFNAGISNDLP